jgi:hypothetical protein
MKQALSVRSFAELLDAARRFNQTRCTPPMENEEMNITVHSAWHITEQGRNHFGQHGAWLGFAEVATMVRDDQDGMVLLAFLRANNGPWASFMCANGLAETFGWTRKRLAEARHRLVELGHIELLRPAATGRPAVYHHHHPGLRHERGRDDRTRRVGGIGRAPPAPHEWRDGDGRAPAAREEGRVTVHDARRAAGSRKRSEPRRRRASGALLPPERRVTEVVKIVGEDRRDNVAGVVSTLIELQDEAAFTRARQGKLHNKRRANQFAAARRRMAAVANQLPLRGELLPHLDFLNGVSVALTHMAVMEPQRPRSNADAKKFAAEAALLERFPAELNRGFLIVRE